MNTLSTLLAALFVAAAATFAAASGGRDGAVIENSGSTNARGYSIKVWSDGRTSTGGGADSHVAADLVQRFFSDVRTAKAGRGGAPLRGCMKSASFGSSTIVHYHGWNSPDLECPGASPLTADVRSIAAALGAGASHPVIRRPMLPNEHRRPEGTPATQPTASPESTRFTP